jgi:hypothetical protein
MSVTFKRSAVYKTYYTKYKSYYTKTSRNLIGYTISAKRACLKTVCFVVTLKLYKMVQIWPGLTVCKQVTVCPGHIWTTLYFLPLLISLLRYSTASEWRHSHVTASCVDIRHRYLYIDRWSVTYKKLNCSFSEFFFHSVIWVIKLPWNIKQW